MTVYKLRVRSYAKEYLDSSDTAVLGISVGKEYHEGEKLLTAVRWVNRKFSRCHIFVADTLQRYNLAFSEKISLFAAAQQAYKLGDSWIERNQTIINTLTIPFEISRWNDWLARPEFNRYRERVQNVYDRDAKYRFYVEQDARRFIFGKEHQWDPILTEEHRRQFSFCVDYILEETAVFASEIGIIGGVELYPGGELESTKAIRQEGIAGMPAQLYRRKFVSFALPRRKRFRDVIFGDSGDSSRLAAN